MLMADRWDKEFFDALRKAYGLKPEPEDCPWPKHAWYENSILPYIRIPGKVVASEECSGCEARQLRIREPRPKNYGWLVSTRDMIA